MEEACGAPVCEAGGGVGAGGVDVEQRDGTALVNDRLGDTRTDAAGRTCDENRLAVESAHA